MFTLRFSSHNTMLYFHCNLSEYGSLIMQAADDEWLFEAQSGQLASVNTKPRDIFKNVRAPCFKAISLQFSLHQERNWLEARDRLVI